MKSNVQYRNNDEYNLLYSTGILDTEFKNDLVWYLNSKHQLKGGVKIGFKRFDPDVVLLKNETIDPNRKIKEYDNFENAIFLEDEMKIGKNLLARLGLRLNSFHASNTFLLNPEPRVSLAYNFKPSWVIKGSYSHMHQYMHMLTNKGVGLPTDLWVPVTDEVPNKKSIQYTLGIQREIPKKNIEVSVETYYKEILNDVSFKEGTSFMQLKKLDELDKDDLSWEKNITTGTSWNYGAEFFIHKKSGRMQGWVAYTMSWAVSKFSDLNFGETFYSRQDRRHNLSIVLIGKISSKISATVNWVYITGNPITLANSAFTYNGSQFQLLYDYSSVNNFRMPAYHRMDAGVTYATFGKKTKRELEFSVYNVYNRFNPYFYYTISTTNVDNTTSFKTNQVSVLPILPSVNYKISF
ncbi:MAG: TonB-dependent receptor plug domain-containing protein [Flavobacteriales bacterium]